MLLHDDFLGWVARDPDKRRANLRWPALHICGPAQRAFGVASGLRAAGIQRGDRVALFLENGVEFVAGLIATLSVGAVVMPINPSTKSDKLGVHARRRTGHRVADAGVPARACGLPRGASPERRDRCSWRTAATSRPPGTLPWPQPDRRVAR